MSVNINIEGQVYYLGPEQKVSEKFTKRELVVETIEKDSKYNQLILVQFTNDRVDMVESLRAGDSVLVNANLRGREWKAPSGETKYFNSVEGCYVQIRGRKEVPTHQEPLPAFDMTSDDPFGFPPPVQDTSKTNNQLFDNFGK